jgi:acetylornithine deacetylase
MPGEDPQEVQSQCENWLEELVEGAPEIFSTKPVVEAPLRWLPGSAISRESPLVQEFAACAKEVLGKVPPVVGMEAPCDMYVFHEFGIPALLWGPAGANAHTIDEYVEIDSLTEAARVLLRFVCEWCGTSSIKAC